VRGSAGVILLLLLAGAVAVWLYESSRQKGAPSAGTSAPLPNDPAEIARWAAMAKALSRKDPKTAAMYRTLAEEAAKGNEEAAKAAAQPGIVQSAADFLRTPGGQVLTVTTGARLVGVDLGRIMAAAGQGIGKVFGYGMNEIGRIVTPSAEGPLSAVDQAVGQALPVVEEAAGTAAESGVLP
jgi:hypothetical protein